MLASTVAVPRTTKLTWQMVSGPDADTDRVSGEAGEAVITCCELLLTNTDAAHTELSNEIELIESWLDTVLKTSRKLLMENSPAYACTSTENWSPMCSGYVGTEMLIPTIVDGAATKGCKLIDPVLCEVDDVLRRTLTPKVSMRPVKNHDDGNTAVARQYPAAPVVVQDPTTVVPLNELGVTSAYTTAPVVIVLKAPSRTCIATTTFGLSAHTPLCDTNEPSTVTAWFVCVVAVAVAWTDPREAVTVTEDPSGESMK